METLFRSIQVVPPIRIELLYVIKNNKNTEEVPKYLYIVVIGCF